MIALVCVKPFHAFGKEYGLGAVVNPADWKPLSKEERAVTVNTRVDNGFLRYAEVEDDATAKKAAADDAAAKQAADAAAAKQAADDAAANAAAKQGTNAPHGGKAPTFK